MPPFVILKATFLLVPTGNGKVSGLGFRVESDNFLGPRVESNKFVGFRDSELGFTVSSRLKPNP